MNTRTLAISIKFAVCLAIVQTAYFWEPFAKAQPSPRPSASERMMHAAFLGEHFVWIGEGAPPEAESEALFLALSSTRTNRWPWSLSALEDFLTENPQSGWAPSVRSQLARAYNETGRYTLALQDWEAVWNATKDYTSGPGKKIADFTLADWTRLLASLGRLETLTSIFAANEGREFNAAVLTKWLRTREAVAVMGRNPGIAYQCGVYALFNAARTFSLTDQARPLLRTSSPSTGFSMKALSDLSIQLGLGFVPVKRESGTELVVPSVIHWQQSHYAAIVSHLGDFYRVVDPTFGKPRWITADTLNAEASGFFMVHSDQMPQGFRLLSPVEAGSVFGRGFLESFNDHDDQPHCYANNGGDSSPPGNDGPGGANSSSPQGCSACGNFGVVVGMPQWRVSEPYINLWIEDEPLGYQPAIGERTSFQIRYNQRQENWTSGAVPLIAGLGPNWTCSWLSAIDTSYYFSYSNFNATFSAFYGQGGNEGYDTLPGLSTNYFNGLKLMALTNSSGALTNFEMLYPDGSIDYYGFAPTQSGSPSGYCYLTQKTSPEGYATFFNYDASDPANVRLTTVVDANGGTNTLNYITNAGTSTVLISKVTDPYGRYVTLSYDASDRLTNIIDVAGISSSIIWDTNSLSKTYGWVTNLTTPYGATSFIPYDNALNPPIAGDRGVTITQPDGGTQLYTFFIAPPSSEPTSYSSSQYPTNDPLNTIDSAPNDSFSYHWGPRQYALLSTTTITNFTWTDFLRARMRHWLGENNGHDTRRLGTLSLERAPSPDGVTAGQLTWYDYTGKFGGFVNSDQGGHILPDYIGRVLPDGSSRSVFTERNSWFFVTNEVTSYTLTGGGIGTRTNVYFYAANDQDFIQRYGPDGVLLENYGYTNHQVTGFTNAAGDWMTNGYNANHQLTQSRSLIGLTSIYTYFASGASINWLQQRADVEVGRTNSLTYYNNGLVQTHTDERGRTVTNTWDNLQRMLTESDGRGTSSYTYKNLDLVNVLDPMNFSTGFAYDNMRRRTGVTNSMGAYTLYNYCNCGALNSIRDAAGNTNSFYYDSADRLTSTVYADGFSITNNYNLLGQIINTVDSSGSSMTNWFNNQSLPIASSNAFGLVKSQTFDFYDRATNVVDANGVAVTAQFDNLGRMISRTYPDTGSEGFGYVAAGLNVYTNQLHFTNFFAYDAGGRKTWETNANWEQTHFQYDPAGDLTNLVDGASHTTSWKFDVYGQVTNKVDNLGSNLFFYAYDADNRLTNRNSAAKGITTYRYDPVGNLTNVVYPVNTALVLSYDVLNRLTNMVDSMGTTHYTYDAVGQLLSEGGLWTDDTVSFTYNNRLRTGLALLQPAASAWSESYGYDVAGRLTSVSSPAGSFSYNYDPTSHQQVSKLLLPNGAYITNTFDNVARLFSTTLKNSGNTALNSHNYGYNTGNQRTALTNFSGDYRLYTYDKIGQLKTAIGNESGGTPRLHEQLSCVYDAAHNLASRTNNNFVDTFNVDSLNRLTSFRWRGLLTIAGTTTSPATNVTVSGAWPASLYADNTWVSQMILTRGGVSILAFGSDNFGRTSTATSESLDPGTEAYSYDLNGNLISDGNRRFDYDDENQLIRVTVTNSWKTEFAYDGKMRCRQRIECSWNGGVWLTNSVTRYVYDGNIVIQERDKNNLPSVTYTRGRDLSGSLQGAGGIGGLLARTDAGLLTVGSPSAHSYYEADGNGNITALINSNQTFVAKYLYDPFGNILSQSGALADANLYRFSSKEFHTNSGLVCFLYRYYDPNLQRWLNRDPLGEDDGINLYEFTYNDAVDHVDRDGLDVTAPAPAPTKPMPTRPPTPPSPEPKPPTLHPPLPKPPTAKPRPPVRSRPGCFFGPLSIFIGEVLDPPSLGDPDIWSTESCERTRLWIDPSTGRTFCTYTCTKSGTHNEEGSGCDRPKFYRVVPRQD